MAQTSIYVHTTHAAYIHFRVCLILHFFFLGSVAFGAATNRGSLFQLLEKRRYERQSTSSRPATIAGIGQAAAEGR